MKLGVLYSGGKDSTLAIHLAANHHKIVCLISLVSENKYSYMFQTANISLTQLQSKAMGIPLIEKKTKGVKEQELVDLEAAIKKAKRDYKIEGIVTGAVRSTYQASRVQKICYELNLWCFNPLWLIDEFKLLGTIVKRQIKPIISGVFAEPFTIDFLGKKINKPMIAKLKQFAKSHKISPAGEGGEIESSVLDAPLFKKKIKILKAKRDFADYAGFYQVLDARLEDK